jgi:hypothetical protein
MSYSGMTVNERLFHARLLDDWDSAIGARVRERAVQILGDVGVDALSAAQTVDAILRDPSKYGFPSP